MGLCPYLRFTSLLLVILGPFSSAFAATVEIRDNRVTLSQSIQVYSEPPQQVKPDYIVPPDDLFKSSETVVPNLGLNPAKHWFKVEVRNELAHQRFVVEAGYPLLDYVDYFVQKDGLLEGPVESGDLRPFSSRTRPHRTLNFSLDLEQGETATLYFLVQTESSVQLPLTLYTEAEFGDNAAAESIGFGLFYGSLIVIMLFNFFQWLMIRELIYAKYVGFLVANLLFQMAINGSLFQWVLPDSPALANVGVLICNFMAWGFAFQFGASFVDLRTVSPGFDKAVRVIAVTCGIGAVASTFLPYRSLVAFVVIFALAFPPIFGAMGIMAMRAGQRSAKYFTMAFALLMIGSVLYALKTATILPSHFVTEYAMQIGSVLQVILLSLALGEQAREVFEQRDALSSEVLEKTRALSAEATKRSEVERERAQAVEELRLEAETKVALFSDATHHLNNPLNHITGAREIISGELALIHERLDVILPDDEDPDVKAVRKAFRQNFAKIAESEMRLDDALSRASNAVSVLRAVSGVDGVGVEPCYFAEIWALLKERIFIADDNARLVPPVEFMELKVLGAPGLYVQAMEVILEEAQHVPRLVYSVTSSELVIAFQGSEIEVDLLESLVRKINHLVKVTGALAKLNHDETVELVLPMAGPEHGSQLMQQEGKS